MAVAEETERDEEGRRDYVRIAALAGLVLIGVAVPVAWFNKDPLTFAVTSVVLAIGCAGYAAILPGAIKTNLPWGVSATGSLGIFTAVLAFMLRFYDAPPEPVPVDCPDTELTACVTPDNLAFNPAETSWVAMDRTTGRPLRVEVDPLELAAEPPEQIGMKMPLELNLDRRSRRYTASIEDEDGLRIGYVTPGALESAGVFSLLRGEERQTESVHVGETQQFFDGALRFELVDDGGLRIHAWVETNNSSKPDVDRWADTGLTRLLRVESTYYLFTIDNSVPQPRTGEPFVRVSAYDLRLSGELPTKDDLVQSVGS